MIFDDFSDLKLKEVTVLMKSYCDLTTLVRCHIRAWGAGCGEAVAFTVEVSWPQAGETCNELELNVSSQDRIIMIVFHLQTSG